MLYMKVHTYFLLISFQLSSNHTDISYCVLILAA